MGLDYWKNVKGYIFYSSNMDGSIRTKYKTLAGKAIFLLWQPNSLNIAFSSYGYITIINEFEEFLFRENLDALDSPPVWSHDGQHLLFELDDTGDLDIYSLDINDWGIVNLTNNSAFDGYPVWSPNDQYIAFYTNRDGNNEIYIMKSDGSFE